MFSGLKYELTLSFIQMSRSTMDSGTEKTRFIFLQYYLADMVELAQICSHLRS